MGKIFDMGKFEKIRNIEFIRCFACLTIILHHLFLPKYMMNFELFSKLHTMTSNGQKAVDLFFILSGFFFVLTLKDKINIWEFLKKKIFRFWPVLVFVMILTAVIPYTPFNFYSAIITFLGLNGTVLIYKTIGTVSVFWYVSAMLWVMTLFLYLLKNYEKKNVDLFIALAVFFSYGMLIHALNGRICGQPEYNGFINVAMLRAIGGIGLGYFIGHIYKSNIEKVKDWNLKLPTKLAVTVLEFCCVFFTINNLLLHKFNFDNQIVFIIVFALTILLFLLKQGFISQFLDKDIWVKISKYTFSIYMTHSIIRASFQHYYRANQAIVHAHPICFILAYIVTAIVLGVITYYLVEKPSNAYLKKKFIK